MSAPVNSRRPYRSPVREERARQTRRSLLDSASRLFIEQGYARTTIRQVAADAGVSEDLVFHLFGTKRGLLKEVMDVGIGGDDEEVALLEREEPRRVREETDQRRQIAMFASSIAGQLARVRPLDDMLRGAASVDAELAALRDDLHLRQRRQAMSAVAGWIAARGPLRQSPEGAAALLWTLTSPEVHHMLVEGWGWGHEQYVEWLRVNLEAGLLG